MKVLLLAVHVYLTIFVKMMVIFIHVKLGLFNRILAKFHVYRVLQDHTVMVVELMLRYAKMVFSQMHMLNLKQTVSLVLQVTFV